METGSLAVVTVTGTSIGDFKLPADTLAAIVSPPPPNTQHPCPDKDDNRARRVAETALARLCKCRGLPVPREKKRRTTQVPIR